MARPRKSSPKRKSPKSADKDQSERFIETARMLGADESAKRFEDIFAKLVPAKRHRRKPAT